MVSWWQALFCLVIELATAHSILVVMMMMMVAMAMMMMMPMMMMMVMPMMTIGGKDPQHISSGSS